MDYKQTRKKYPNFIYKSYKYSFTKKGLKVSFDFLIEPDISFFPSLIIEGVKEPKISKENLENLIFNLGMIESLSYWKATCSKNIIIEAGKISRSQAKWWEKLILKGMGQYFWENKINFKEKDFIKISSKGKEFKSFKSNPKKQILVPIGGGKDSIVTLEKLKKTNPICFALNPNKTIKNVIKISGCKHIFVKREIDKELLRLNKKGFLNGHTPFSAYLAFLTTLTATLLNKKYIALSNEASSNEANVKYLKEDINHQYSKTYEFEKDFQNYSKKYLNQDIIYFSYLRPYHEIQIAEMFSKHKKYFKYFLSCNKAFTIKSKNQKWCNNCSKCLFAFNILSCFLNEKQIIGIFKENLFDKKELLPIMLDLIGDGKCKPFECVGTYKESLVAFYINYKKNKDENLYLLNYFEKNILSKHKNLEAESKKILNSFNKKNLIPKEFQH